MMRRLVGCVIGSRYRLKPVAGVVKLTGAVDEVSVTRWLVGKETRMMSTAAGESRDHDNSQKEAVKATEDVGAEDVSNDSWESFKVLDHRASDEEVVKTPDNVGGAALKEDSWESFQERLVDDPYWRCDKQTMAIFKRWSEHYNKVYTTEAQKKRRFDVFKKKMRHIDAQNYKWRNLTQITLRLDAHSDLTNWEYILAAKKGKF